MPFYKVHVIYSLSKSEIQYSTKKIPWLTFHIICTLFYDLWHDQKNCTRQNLSASAHNVKNYNDLRCPEEQVRKQRLEQFTSNPHSGKEIFDLSFVVSWEMMMGQDRPKCCLKFPFQVRVREKWYKIPTRWHSERQYNVIFYWWCFTHIVGFVTNIIIIMTHNSHTANSQTEDCLWPDKAHCVQNIKKGSLNTACFSLFSKVWGLLVNFGS